MPSLSPWVQNPSNKTSPTFSRSFSGKGFSVNTNGFFSWRCLPVFYRKILISIVIINLLKPKAFQLKCEKKKLVLNFFVVLCFSNKMSLLPIEKQANKTFAYTSSIPFLMSWRSQFLSPQPTEKPWRDHSISSASLLFSPHTGITNMSSAELPPAAGFEHVSQGQACA